MIVGTGNVGASIGFSLVSQRTAVNELILTDINAEDAKGEAMDLRDTLAVSPSYMKIRAGEYSDAGDCDIIIITAGVPQKPGETRLELLKNNAKVFKEMIPQIMAAGFNGIFIVVSNPMDVLTYLTWQYSGLPAEQVIGSGTALDSARLRFKIAEELDIHPKSVHAYQVGEHGDSELTLWHSANVAGRPLTKILNEKKRQEISDFAAHEAYEIINKKGATYYGIGACVTQIVNTILHDEKRVLPVSSYDDFTDTYYGFPTVVGRAGVLRKMDTELSETEATKLQKSANAIRQALDSIKD